MLNQRILSLNCSEHIKRDIIQACNLGVVSMMILRISIRPMTCFQLYWEETNKKSVALSGMLPTRLDCMCVVYNILHA